jgi:hypothetical protein
VTDSEVLRQAAKFIHNNSRRNLGCCGAIGSIPTTYVHIALLKMWFNHMYGPNQEDFYFGIRFDREETNHRVLALLFMAEMYEEPPRVWHPTRHYSSSLRRYSPACGPND